jgi:hypothetical protein
VNGNAAAAPTFPGAPIMLGSTMLCLSATRTHLYPGARGRVASGVVSDGPVEIAFADGSHAFGSLLGRRLDLHTYDTAAGTAIPQKAWTIVFTGGDFHVRGRA